MRLFYRWLEECGFFEAMYKDYDPYADEDYWEYCMEKWNYDEPIEEKE